MEKKLTLKHYMAYGIGQAGDTVPYCMFYTYFVFFLTDVVGLSPAVAGAVSLIGVCWDAVTDPIVGFLSDRTKSPSGRRRPWMIGSILPLAALVFLIFAPFEFSSKGLATAYYIIIATLFWTLYTTYVIPYMSLAAEMTSSEKERYSLRVANMICGGLFMLMCSSGPMVVWQWGIDRGLSDRAAWGLSGIIFGVIALVFGLLSWRFTRGTEQPVTEETSRAGHASLPWRMILRPSMMWSLRAGTTSSMTEASSTSATSAIRSFPQRSFSRTCAPTWNGSSMRRTVT